MVTNYMFEKIKELSKKGMSNRAIARELGKDARTIGKYVSSHSAPKYKKRVKESRLNPMASFDEQTRTMLKSVEELTAFEIFMVLKDHNYSGSLRTVQRRIATIKGERPKERFFEQEYEPGEQTQIDFKECVTLPFIDGERLIHLHFATLPFSDHFGIRGYSNRTYECLMDGNHHFFESIGGITENLRFDNMAPIVKKILRGTERIYTEAFLKAQDYYGFGALPCAPGKGSEKGDVEREIRTQAGRIQRAIKLSGKIFRDFDDLNKWLADYSKRFQTEKSQKLLAIEREHLKPLLPYSAEIIGRVTITKPLKHGLVRIKNATYSVPDKMIGVECRVVQGPYAVNIFRLGGAQDLIATHPLKQENESSVLLEHVLPSLVRKPGAMVRWPHRGILFPNEVFKRFYAKLQKIYPDSAEREFLRTINLIQYTSLSEIEAGIELVLGASAPCSFDEMRRIILGDGHRPVDPNDPRIAQIPLKPELSIYDSLIPNMEVSA